MSEFDLKAFRKARFVAREEDVPLPGLAEAGLGGEADPETGEVAPVVFRVRGLTANELARADEEADTSKLLLDVAERLASSKQGDKAQALLDGLGLGGGTPAALRRKICHVAAGVVSPELDQQDVVKLADAFPIEFGQLAHKIYELTGKGKAAQVKPKPSGSATTSKPA